MKELLNIDNLHLSFNTPLGELKAVRGVSLSLLQGETLALVGESGCGKSVTARSIIHLNPSPPAKITEGEIRLLGENITDAPESRMNKIRGKEIGMVFQDPMSSLNPSMQIWRQLTDGMRKHSGLSTAQCRKEAVRLLEMVRISQAEVRARQYPYQLSGGMRQRVMIAMALSCNPKILIADEPTTALDVTIQAEILALLKGLKQELKMATLFITHDLAVAANIADHVALMYAGRIVESGPASAVFSIPAHPYTSALFKSHPARHRAAGQELPVIQGALPDLTKPIKGCAFAPRCSFCTKKCTEEEPPVRALSPGHQVSCFMYQDLDKGGRAWMR